MLNRETRLPRLFLGPGGQILPSYHENQIRSWRPGQMNPARDATAGRMSPAVLYGRSVVVIYLSKKIVLMTQKIGYTARCRKTRLAILRNLIYKSEAKINY